MQSQEWLDGQQRTLVKVVVGSCKTSVPCDSQEELEEPMGPQG